MKKYLSVLTALCCFVLHTYAQDKIPSFGKIDKADLEMKDCSFDPGAEAEVLFDVGDMQFAYIENVGWQSESNYRVRVKILKASAIYRGSIKINYYSLNRRQEITNISGISYNLDAVGNVEESRLEKSAIFNKSIDKKNSELSFALPNVKVGTVFEYKYTMIRKSYSYIPTWTFQQSIPVKYSAYNITLPEYFQFTTQSICRQPMEKKDADYKGTYYIMRNVPALKEEPFSFGKKDYLQRIEFQLSKIDAPNYYKEYRNNWPKIIDELLDDEDFGLEIKKKIKDADDLEGPLEKAKSTKEKIQVVYKYVQSNMQWNDDYSIFADKGIKDAWDKKNGNIAEINFILINLLRNAGVDAKPLIASTKDNGIINTIFPFLQQFNCVLAYVADGNDRYIMNAADKYNPFNLVPYDVLYSNGLVVSKPDGGLVGLNSDKKYESNIFFSANVDASANLLGNATLSSQGYARNVRLGFHKKGKLNALLQDNEGITIKVDSIEFNNEKNELLPFEQKVKFSGNLQSSGQYYFLPYSVFTGLGKNPFIQETRVMDIDFNYPKTYVITGSYILPDEFVVNELPKNTKIILPDTSIVLTRLTQNDDNIISFKLTIDFKAPGYSAGSYPFIKEFFKQLYNILDERIVLQKK